MQYLSLITFKISCENIVHETVNERLNGHDICFVEGDIVGDKLEAKDLMRREIVLGHFKIKLTIKVN